MGTFDLDTVLNSLEEREKEYGGKGINRDDLRSNLCARKNPYASLYPDAVIRDPEGKMETVNFFERPDYYTYYRIEPAKASEYYQVHKTVIVYLTTDENYVKDEASFIEYFGVSPSELARRVKNGDILPLMGPAEIYKKGKAREAYAPFFAELRPDIDRSKGPFYANRLEDSLAKQYHNGRTWQHLRREEIDRVCPKEGGEIVLHSLRHRDAQTYYGERVAWLKLLGWDDAAEVVKTVAEKETKDAAKVIAHVIHNLVSAPVFYARKGLHSIYVPTEFHDYKNCITILDKISNEYGLPRKPLPYHIANAVALLKTLLKNFLRPVPDQDSVKPMMHLMVIPTSDEESRDAWCYFNEKGLSQDRESASHQKVNQGQFLLKPSANVEKAVKAAFAYRQYIEKVNSAIAAYSATKGSIYLRYISVPIGGILMGTTAALIPLDLQHLFIDVCKQVWESDPTPLLERILSKADRSVSEDAESKARNFDFLPALLLWGLSPQPVHVKWAQEV